MLRVNSNYGATEICSMIDDAPLHYILETKLPTCPSNISYRLLLAWI